MKKQDDAMKLAIPMGTPEILIGNKGLNRRGCAFARMFNNNEANALQVRAPQLIHTPFTIIPRCLTPSLKPLFKF